jgi:hypothetical protein
MTAGLDSSPALSGNYTSLPFLPSHGATVAIRGKHHMTYRVETWFERDRAHVQLLSDDDEILSIWDDEVSELVEDGFLDPRDWLGSAIDYATQAGLIQNA